MPPSPLAEYRPEVRRTLPWLVAFRLVSNGAFRYAYSFLPALARGTGFSVEELSRVLSARDLTAVAAPAMGRLSDRHSTRTLMVATSALLVGGLFVASVGPFGLVIGFMFVGIGKLGYDIAMNSWVGESIAYQRRGRAMGLVELSWAGSALILLPILGILIDHVGWWSASAFLGLLGLPLVGVMAAQARADSPRRANRPKSRRPILNAPIVMTLLALVLMSISSQFLVVGHGLWLADTYQFDATQIGFAIVAIGAVEAAGSLASSRFTDRLGKKNSMTVGVALLAVAMGMMAVAVDPALGVGLALLALAFLGFEFALVSALPLISELDPGARAQMLGWSLGLSTLVRAACSVIGVSLYVHRGFAWLSGIGSAAALAAVVVLATVVPEPANPAAGADLLD